MGKLFVNYNFIKQNTRFIKFARIYNQIYKKNEPEKLNLQKEKLHHISEFPSETFKVEIPKTSHSIKLFSNRQIKNNNSELENKKSESHENTKSSQLLKIEEKSKILESIYLDKETESLPQKPENSLFSFLESTMNKAIEIFERDDSKFTVVKKKKNLLLGKVIEEGNPVVLIRARQILPVNHQIVFETLFNIESRSKWDKVVLESSIQKEFDPCTDLIYSTGPKFALSTQRDFLMIRRIYKNLRGYDSIILTKSIEDPIKPVVKKRVRADCQVGASLIKKLGPDKTMLGVIMQIDIKGLVPKMIVNMIAPSQSGNWFKTFEKEIQRQKKQMENDKRS